MKISLVNGLLMVAFAVAVSVSSADNSPPNTTTTAPTTITPASTTEPTTTDPITTKSHTTEPPTTEPITTKPITTQSPVTTPKPPPEPLKGNWNVTADDNKWSCILFDAGIRMKFNYMNSSQLVTDYQVDVPGDAIASGSCNSENQTMLLTFYDNWVLEFDFHLDHTNKKYSLVKVLLQYNEKKFPDAKEPKDRNGANNDTLFATELNKNYHCKSELSVLKRDIVDTVGVVDISVYQLQFEAFGNFTTHSFSSGSNECSADGGPSQLVPIIVGAVLAGLIVVVLIAYLIGRKRSRRGYESV